MSEPVPFTHPTPPMARALRMIADTRGPACAFYLLKRAVRTSTLDALERRRFVERRPTVDATVGFILTDAGRAALSEALGVGDGSRDEIPSDCGSAQSDGTDRASPSLPATRDAQ